MSDANQRITAILHIIIVIGRDVVMWTKTRHSLYRRLP